MASKTSVTGNRVTIDDSVYEVKPAGAGKYTVFDEFGGRLGNLTVKGKGVDPEDYGVSGAHPVAQIGKLWAAVNLSKPDEKGAQEGKRVCRIATHEKPAAADLQKAKAHLAWLRKQPGVKAAYIAHDPATGKTLTLSVWESREELAALKDRTPPDGAAPMKSVSVELLPVIDDA
jgi:hypothetical protein